MTSFCMLMIAGLIFVSGSALAQELPTTATKATPEQFKQFADGKTIDVEILDMGQTITATLVWNWTDQKITGTAVIDGSQDVNVDTAMSFDGEKACATGASGPVCHTIYIDSAAGKFYEVRDDDAVHAISTIKP